ncbi:MAG: hypothetical protein HC852_11265, partial [Acaryochloridaceae cyanobacterium RU_4_10]|nr:hypothetical protein [Acaryochloridaceae cyanobacterium RU_4_10]
GNEDELKARIVRLLYEGFGHNGNRVKFKFVNRVHVAPEGDGIRQIAKRFPAVFLMFGHKDFTLGYIKDKEISLVDSRSLPGWGMLKFVRQIPYTFVDELRAAAAIYAAGEKLQDKHLLKVVLPKDLARVKAAIPEVRRLIWAQLWKELIDSPINEAAIAYAIGGNAVFWYPELKKALGQRLNMGGELIKEISERFPDLDKSPSLYRLSDCFGSFKDLESGNSYVPSARKELLGGGKK